MCRVRARFPFFRAKFRNKLVYIGITLAVLLLWIIASQYNSRTDIGNIQPTPEMTLHDRMKLRRAMIKQQYCNNHGNFSSTRSDLSLHNFVRPQFLPNFKNPCFVQNITTGTKTKETFGCLPYFIVAGFPKAGTTDLWSRFMNHPDMVLQHVKEPMYFNKGKLKMPLKSGAQNYITFFSKSANVLNRLICPFECRSPFPFFHGITGEASVDTIYDNKDWQLLPGNEGCTEPVVTNADYVYQLNPNIKVILVLRNPIERLYSDYIYESRFYGYETTQTDFHHSVMSAIQNFTDCVQHNTVRSCVYNSTVSSNKIRLKIGLYHVYIEDWLAVFPPSNVLAVQSEETLTDRKSAVYRRIFQFLQIRPFTRQEEARIFARGPINTRSRPEKDVGDMWKQTRHLLYQFYKPFNDNLKLLLPVVDYNNISK